MSAGSEWDSAPGLPPSVQPLRDEVVGGFFSVQSIALELWQRSTCHGGGISFPDGLVHVLLWICLCSLSRSALAFVGLGLLAMAAWDPFPKL